MKDCNQISSENSQMMQILENNYKQLNINKGAFLESNKLEITEKF